MREYKLGVMEGKRKGMSGCGGAARGKAAFPNGFEVDREREWLRGCVVACRMGRSNLHGVCT